MNTKTEYLVNSIYEKLKNFKSKKIALNKDDFKKFIFHIIKNTEI